MEAQFAELAANPDVLVATPGRLLHHLVEVEGMHLKSVVYCVFDEADRMFEMGFADQARPQSVACVALYRVVMRLGCIWGNACVPFSRAVV